MKIKIKKLDERAILPTRGSDYAAGWDLYALTDHNITIEGSETVLVHTGISIEIPDGYFGAIYARSGLAIKRGLAPANCVGIIDSDYRGEIIVGLHNNAAPVVPAVNYITSDVTQAVPKINSDANEVIKDGDRIAQLIIQKFEDIEFEEISELSDTGRGQGGFGSTGE